MRLGDGCSTNAGKALEQTGWLFLCVSGQSCLYFWLFRGRAEVGGMALGGAARGFSLGHPFPGPALWLNHITL